jgi:hypothetical protein
MNPVTVTTGNATLLVREPLPEPQASLELARHAMVGTSGLLRMLLSDPDLSPRLKARHGSLMEMYARDLYESALRLTRLSQEARS